jgi:hypothetical protein
VLSSEDESRPVVIDGQQRLTTLMLLMSVLRDECHDRDLTTPVQRIDKRLTADDFAEGDDRFKFKTGTVNWPVFRDFVLRTPTDPKRKSLDDAKRLDRELRARNDALLDNYARLRGHVRAYLASMGEDRQRAWLQAFDKAVMERVELVVIQVKELADAFLLFETLNDRGLQLSAADLLKSHLLGQIAKKHTEEEVEEAARRWDEMLEDLGAQVDVSRFLRHYLLGSAQAVKKDEVFNHFKGLVAKSEASAVLEDLRKAAACYGEFENPSRVSHEPTRQVLSDLQTLRASVCYIALIPARRYLSETDFLECARLAEVLTYRYSSVVGLGTNDIERKYRDAAQVLNKSHGAKLAEARAILIGAMPDSEQFKVAFERLSMGTQYLLRYSLRKLEEHVAPTLEKKIQASNLVHIEHIMPQTLSDAWRATLGAQVEAHAEYVHRWGNLTLLFSGLNIPASNRSFEEKKAYYKGSQVELTKLLSEGDVWGLAQIEERQRKLAELADEVWAVPQVPVAGAEVSPALESFRSALDSMWEVVAPFCIEMSPEQTKQMSELLVGHLAEHALHKTQARDLSGRLEKLLEGWEELDASERAVVAGAVNYFLEADDAAPDVTVGGLVDDEAVVAAAEAAIRIAPSSE